LDSLVAIFDALAPNPAEHDARTHQAIIWLIQAFMKAAWMLLSTSVNTHLKTRVLWTQVNLAGSILIGFLRDGLLYNAFSVIDDLDARAWFARHGANEITLESGLVRGGYDLVFGMVGGETKRASVAAGVTLQGLLCMALTYRGAIFWEMQAGMGDTV